MCLEKRVATNLALRGDHAPNGAVDTEVLKEFQASRRDTVGCIQDQVLVWQEVCTEASDHRGTRPIPLV